MNYGLPKSVEINGEEFEIRYDYRVILEIFEAMNDAELNDEERGLAVLQMFYVDFEKLTDYETAVKKCMEFITCEKQQGAGKKKEPQLIDWAQDFQYIAGPINRVLGYEIREKPYDIETNTGGVHWWTFVGAYSEIGDCFFAQVVSIRDKKARGKALDKQEREFYRKNRDVVDLKVQLTENEKNIMEIWGVSAKQNPKQGYGFAERTSDS